MSELFIIWAIPIEENGPGFTLYLFMKNEKDVILILIAKCQTLYGTLYLHHARPDDRGTRKCPKILKIEL